MTAKSIVTNEHRYNPLFHQAIQTIKINNLKGVSDPKSIISKQVGGIFYLRHQIGLSNALYRIKVFNLCKKMV